MHALIVNFPTTMTLMLCKLVSYKVMWTWTDVSCAAFTPTAEAVISDMTIICKHRWLNHSIQYSMNSDVICQTYNRVGAGDFLQ